MGGGLVEHEHPPVGEQRPRDPEALPLAAGHRAAMLADQGVEAVRECGDPVAELRPAQGLEDRGVVVRRGELEVGAQGAVEEVGAGAAPGDARADVVGGEPAHVAAVGGEAARGRVERAQDGGHDGGLRRTGRSGQPAAGGEREVDVAHRVAVRSGPPDRQAARTEPGRRRDGRPARGDRRRRGRQIGQPGDGLLAVSRTAASGRPATTSASASGVRESTANAGPGSIPARSAAMPTAVATTEVRPSASTARPPPSPRAVAARRRSAASCWSAAVRRAR